MMPSVQPGADVRSLIDASYAVARFWPHQGLPSWGAAEAEPGEAGSGLLCKFCDYYTGA